MCFSCTVLGRLFEHIHENRHSHIGSRHVDHLRKHGLGHNVALRVFTLDYSKTINNACTWNSCENTYFFFLVL